MHSVSRDNMMGNHRGQQSKTTVENSGLQRATTDEDHEGKLWGMIVKNDHKGGFQTMIV